MTQCNQYSNMKGLYAKYAMYNAYQLICMQLIQIVFRHGKTTAGLLSVWQLAGKKQEDKRLLLVSKLKNLGCPFD